MDSNRPSAGKWVSRRALAQQAQSRECMSTTAINCNTSTNSRPPQPRSATVNRNGSDNDHYHRHGYVHDNRSGSGLYYSRNTNNHNGGSSVMKAVNANHHSRYYNSKSSDGSDLSPPPPRSAQLANGTAAARPHSSYIPSPRHASQFGIEPHNISNSRWAPPPPAPMSSNGPSMLGIYEQPLTSNPPSFVQALQGKPAPPPFTNGNSNGHCGFSTSAADVMPPPPQYVAMPSNKSPAPQYCQSPLLTLIPTPAPVPASVTARSPTDAPASLAAAMDLSTMLHHMTLRVSESHPSPPSGSSTALEEAAQQIGLMLPVLDDDDEDVRSAKPHSSVAMASLLDSWNNGGISTTAADFAITFDAATTAGTTDPSRQMNLNKAFSTAPVVPPVNPISASLFSQLTGESPEAAEGATGFTGFSALHCDPNPSVPAQPKSTDLRDLFSELTQPGGNDLETVGDVPGSVSWPTLPPLENSNASFVQEGPSGKVASSAWKQLCVQIAAPADFGAPRVDINSTPLIPGSTSSLLTDASTPLCAKRDSSQPHTPAAIRQQRPSLDPPTVTRLSLACIFRETPQSQRRREKALETSQRPDTLTQSHHWPPHTDAEVERMLKQRSALKLLRHLTIISYSRQHVKGVQELFETWARNGIPAPDMGFGAYYYYVKEKSEKLLCMKHNGRGATPGHGYGKCDFESRRPNSTCRYEHVCLFCRSKEHGWFEEGKCDGYQQLLNEAEVLGITDESIEVLLNAMEKTSAWTH